MTYADLTESDKADLYEGGAALIKPLIDAKQDKIIDLDAIREGAELGKTALQEESDPTVPEWAKQPNKPTYTPNEIGAATEQALIEHTQDNVRHISEEERNKWDGKQDKIEDLQAIRNNASTGAALANDIRDMTAQASLPTGGVLESGKTYGSPTSPLAVESIDGTGVTTESVVYFNADENVTISYTGAINEPPTRGIAVVSFEYGVAVFGSITI